MSKKNKKIYGWIAFVFVCFHMIALFIYAAPEQFRLGQGRNFVAHYVSPLFAQNWSMFAPCPVVKGKIYVKIQYADETIDWFDPRASDRKWHTYLRGSHHGDRVLLEANILHHFWASAADFGLVYNEPIPDHLAEAFTETPGFVFVKRYAYGVARNVRDEKPEKIWARVEMQNLQTGESGVLELPVMTWW